MNNKKKIAGIVVVCIFATILGVWMQHNKKDEEVMIVSGLDMPETATADPTSASAVASPLPVTEPDNITVHVCGSVNNPGVYVLTYGTRVNDAISMAGGFSEDANEDYLNLADVLLDGIKIYVPSTEETKIQETVPGISLPGEALDTGGSAKVNINTATKEELMSLTGVGEAKANAIIEYRNNNGGFKSIEDIMNIPGIKEGLFNKIKDKIAV